MRSSSSPRRSLPWLRLRSVGNLVNLSTPTGLLVAALGRASVERRPRGLFLAEHYRLPFPVAGAFTVGNVIITRGRWEDIERRYPRLLDHEEAHTWQYLYCFGLPYYLAYSACMAWSLLRTGDRASANFFERQADLGHGGYTERPKRPPLTAARTFFSSRS
ncbi:MAG TPA: hypothetical protein VF635_11805 [Propionibacteriaceae bacterium]